MVDAFAEVEESYEELIAENEAERVEDCNQDEVPLPKNEKSTV